MSHLLQMRGLKPELQNTLSNFCSRIFYRCVDWNKHLYAEGREGYLRRIFYRCVDWNKLSKKSNLPLLCRIFYRCVDWNLFWHRKSLKQKVASFTDAWIETTQNNPLHISCYVASFTDAWIETIRFLTYHRLNGSHLLQMRGLKHLTKAQAEYTSESHLLQMRGLKQLLKTELFKSWGRIFYRCVDWNFCTYSYQGRW